MPTFEQLQATNPDEPTPDHLLTRAGHELPVVIQELVTLDKSRRVTPDYAIIYGNPQPNCVVGIHTENFYTDILGGVTPSDHDSGRDRFIPPIDTAVDMIWKEGNGVIFYRRDMPLTVRASQEQKYEEDREGFRPLPDKRSYHREAVILSHHLGLKTVRLVTGDSRKVEALRDADPPIEVTVIPPELKSEFRSKSKLRPALQRLGQVFSRKRP